MKRDDNDYISKFVGTDCKNIKEEDAFEKNKNENDFYFLLSPNIIHKTIFDIKAQTKNIKTADLLKLLIVQKIMSAEKMQNDCNRSEYKRNNSDDFIDIKKPQARMSEKTKLKIVQEFYLRIAVDR